ncbi:MAG: REDY-like protein HapK [Bacteroidota bacterium]|nr:REDY-like protein HapK [Candidatus Kapabacteria bacterium]MDW8219215.1 REDY-like protein HapK [Bacteroidota bacterium]
MPKIIVLFNLKSGVDPAEYESWARTSDVPTVNALDSVRDFHVLKALSVLGSDAAPPYKYIEVIDVENMEQFLADITTEAIQKGAAQFAQYADNPVFIVTEHCA